jgi:hypothetical protein
MTKNIGSADKIMRLLVAIVCTALYVTHTVSGIFGTILLIAGGVLLTTSFINFCPFYAVFGINTCSLKTHK